MGFGAVGKTNDDATDTLLLATGAATFFVGANWIMKEYAYAALPLVIPAAAMALACGAAMELEILKSNRLGQTVILIFVFEIAVTFAMSIMMFGEQYSFREIIGLAVIALGMVILCWSASGKDQPTGKLEAARLHIVMVTKSDT